MHHASRAARRLGINHCELDGKPGTAQNPLNVHHIDGNRANNNPKNLMVVHSKVCHLLADYVTQTFNSRGVRKATWHDIKKAFEKLYHLL